MRFFPHRIERAISWLLAVTMLLAPMAAASCNCLCHDACEAKHQACAPEHDECGAPHGDVNHHCRLGQSESTSCDSSVCAHHDRELASSGGDESESVSHPSRGHAPGPCRCSTSHERPAPATPSSVVRFEPDNVVAIAAAAPKSSPLVAAELLQGDYRHRCAGGSPSLAACILLCRFTT